jgi:hypothetical protein
LRKSPFPLREWEARNTVANVENDPAIRIIAAMTPEQRLNAAMRLYWSARELKAAYTRSMHPDWSEEQVRKEVRDAFIRS